MSRGWRDELARIRYRLVLVNLIILSVPVAGIGFARFHERQMLRALEEDMIHQGQLLANVLRADPQGLRIAEREALLAAAVRDTRTRIRLLDDKGEVRADSHRGGPPEGPERGRTYDSIAPLASVLSTEPTAPATRAEVRRALSGHYGSQTRIWHSPGGQRVYLFAAMPITDAAGKTSAVVYLTRSTAPVLLALYRLRTALLWVLGGAFTLAVALSLFLAGTIARPLSRLSRLAEQVARGDRSVSLALRRRDEIGQLARAIDAMARRLDQRAQDGARLAADLSRELESPLTSIRAATELLLDGADEEPEARRRLVGTVLADAGRLDRLVTRLLELSRLEADAAPAEDLDLEALVVDTAAPLADAATPLALQYRAQRRLIRGRPDQLASALCNLIENARQHAAPGTPVEIVVEERGPDRLRVSVHNQGEPIAPADLPRIWDRFFTTRAGAGGSGLGLPIVASVVTAHGGEVFVESAPGAGTTVGFALPVA
jgi:two-component system sensor histidine kinase ChvG